AGRQLRVVLSRQPFANLAADAQNPFVANFLPRGENSGAIGLEDDLCQAVAVTQVDEDLVVVGAVGIDPAVENDGLADMRLAQLAAGVGSPLKGHVRGSSLGSRARSTSADSP